MKSENEYFGSQHISFMLIFVRQARQGMRQIRQRVRKIVHSLTPDNDQVQFHLWERETMLN